MEESHDEIRRGVLLAASHQAMTAAEAMMRAALEGAPVDDETMEKLADAVKLLAIVDVDGDDPPSDVMRFMAEATAFLNGDC